ncbi:MAG: FeS assembly SUF system protein [Ignavibacteria bacterium GWF2_33_9]|nr:MAG: FeS assembly SUF system protein [Ignavibacteria bacterium GWF2_33_9]
MAETTIEKISAVELEQKIIEAIKLVYDPEIPVNVYDLGLIYDIKITEDSEAVVLMTLTAPTCPVAGGLPADVETSIKQVPEVKDAKVILTFDPPWDPSLLSDEAKLILGMM